MRITLKRNATIDGELCARGQTIEVDNAYGVALCDEGFAFPATPRRGRTTRAILMAERRRKIAKGAEG
uniref:Uncharacterized protein n=1 Tax=viral metagenome TaxID=1070528 RepID=A0A6M3KC76_9ZZZZ